MKPLSVALITFSALSFFTKPAIANNCPTAPQDAAITYNHNLYNQYGTFIQTSIVTGKVGIEVGPYGIFGNANNILTRTINSYYTTTLCSCRAEEAVSRVIFSAGGFCSDGLLSIDITEVYENSEALMICTGDDSCSSYTQYYPGTTVNHTLLIPFEEDALVEEPYQGMGGSGIYSWRLNFGAAPPPPPDAPRRVNPVIYNLLLGTKEIVN